MQSGKGGRRVACALLPAWLAVHDAAPWDVPATLLGKGGSVLSAWGGGEFGCLGVSASLLCLLREQPRSLRGCSVMEVERLWPGSAGRTPPVSLGLRKELREERWVAVARRADVPKACPFHSQRHTEAVVPASRPLPLTAPARWIGYPLRSWVTWR